MKKMILAALILVTFSVSDAQAMMEGMSSRLIAEAIRAEVNASALMASAIVLTGLAMYKRNEISKVGKKAIAWMKENKGISIAIITTIILGSYGMCLFAKWNLDNDTDKSFGGNFTAANSTLWKKTAKRWIFATEHPWFVGITLGGMAIAGTAGYLLSKKAATTMYDEITGQHDEDNIFG